MANEFRNIILAGIGSAAYSYEKAHRIVDDMVSKGKLTIDEGKDLSEELKRTLDDKSTEKSSEKPFTKDDLVSLFKEMNFATKDDLAIINNRLTALEDQK